MQKAQLNENEAKKIVRQYQILLSLGFAVIGTGSVFYHFVEDWRWIDALYFSVISLTTVGYGDITPKTDIGKLFTMVFLFVGIGLMAGLVNNLIHSRIAKQSLKSDKN